MTCKPHPQAHIMKEARIMIDFDPQGESERDPFHNKDGVLIQTITRCIVCGYSPDANNPTGGE